MRLQFDGSHIHASRCRAFRLHLKPRHSHYLLSTLIANYPLVSSASRPNVNIYNSQPNKIERNIETCCAEPCACDSSKQAVPSQSNVAAGHFVM